MARRAWSYVAAAALALMLRVDAADPSADTGVMAGIEADLLQLQSDDAGAVQQLAKQALDPASSAATATRALVELGDLFFYGNATLGTRVNGTRALRFYSRAADQGDARAQFHVGVAQSYGFWGVARDEPAALVQYYFAALGGDTAASLALGHRHSLGVGTPKNCESAVRYYEVAANRAVALREAAGNQPAIVDATPRRLKTVAEAQHKKNVPSDAAIVDYYEFSADKGDPDATLHLATLYYYGARGLEQDLTRAATLFHKAYALGASGGAYHLGHIYSRGLGVAANNATALQYLQEAAAAGSTQAMNELASMHLHGRGTARDVRQATTLFQTAAKQGSMDAFYNLGVLHMQPRSSSPSGTSRREPEYEVAHGYFQVAAHQGHTVASHKLAHMSLHGIGTTRSCKSAVDSFKLVAERGPWDRVLARAFADFMRQDYAAAFAKYAVMAQQGYEVAQHNAAYLLDHGYLSPLLEFADAEAAAAEAVAPADAREAAALALYKLAALQGNVDANLKIGDFYYYGRGGRAVDWTRASAHYSLASKRANAQALFNLAYMYEHGVGVEQDLPLAKRFLDKARDAHSDAHVPVALALWKLQAHALLVSWRRMWDIWVGNVAAPVAVPPTEPVSPTTPAGSRADGAAVAATAESSSAAESLLAAWWPSIVSGADATATQSPGSSGDSALRHWRDIVHHVLESDDFLILLLLFTLGVVLYIRSERQHMLGDPMPPQAQAPQAQ